MRYLFDTNVIIEAAANSQPAVAALHRAVNSRWVGFSAITRIELFGYPGLTTEEESALTIIVGQLEEVGVTRIVVDHTIRIRRLCKVKVPDAIIAATAIDMEAMLVTRNEDDFKAIPGLKVFNPWR